MKAVAVLRIFFGLVYFTNGLSKFVPGIAHLPGGYYLIDSQGAESIIAHNAAHHQRRTLGSTGPAIWRSR